jgi:hypothetical protein
MSQSSNLSMARPSQRSSKFWMQIIAGAIVGAGTMGLALWGVDQIRVDELKGDEVLALGTGAIYCIMGVFVGLGVIFPRQGSKLLNVEDEAELVEQRRLLGWGALQAVLVGVAVLALVAASPSLALISGVAAAAAFGAMLVLATGIGLWTANQQDEFQRRIGSDSAVLALNLIGTLFGIWAALAHLGFAAMFSPLAFVCGVLAIYLLAIFWVAGKRGLMNN